MLTVASESSEASDTCILQFYYMARACKYITRAVIGQYSGPDFPVMPTGIVSDVNVRLVTWKYRKCKSTFGSNRWNDLKLKNYFFLCDIPGGILPEDLGGGVRYSPSTAFALS